MLSLSLQQREAFRNAAEQKWLARHSSFKPEDLGGIEESRKPARMKQDRVLDKMQAAEETAGSRKAEDVEQRVPETDQASEAIKQALAEKGGLVVPVCERIINPLDHVADACIIGAISKLQNLAK